MRFLLKILIDGMLWTIGSVCLCAVWSMVKREWRFSRIICSVEPGTYKVELNVTHHVD